MRPLPTAEATGKRGEEKAREVEKEGEQNKARGCSNQEEQPAEEPCVRGQPAQTEGASQQGKRERSEAGVCG